jgi:hypothetical protein
VYFSVGFLPPRWGLENFGEPFSQGVALGYFLSALQAFNSCLSAYSGVAATRLYAVSIHTALCLCSFAVQSMTVGKDEV